MIVLRLAEGKALGRPPSLTDDQRKAVERRLDEGATVSALAREFKIERTFAYLRVSIAGQTTDNQLQEIKAAGFNPATCWSSPSSIASGLGRDREGLGQAVDLANVEYGVGFQEANALFRLLARALVPARLGGLAHVDDLGPALAAPDLSPSSRPGAWR